MHSSLFAFPKQPYETLSLCSFATLKQKFEDALQMVAAAGIPGINCIVTRNLKDFKHSEVEVRSPDEFVKKLK